MITLLTKPFLQYSQEIGQANSMREFEKSVMIKEKENEINLNVGVL